MTAPSLRDERAQAERRNALRALLARPLLLADRDPETFAAVVRHRTELTRWFADHAGWTLVIDAGGRHARLLKRPVRPDPTRPAGAPGKGPFDRRRYVLLCLALAAIDGEGAQVTLARLAERVRELSLEDAALVPFDPESPTERHAFVDVLRLLGDLGVVVFKDGDADRYVRDRRAGDALYDVRERLLARLLSAPRPPAIATGPAHMAEEEHAGTEEGERVAGRQEVFRRLLDDPVTYREDLSPRAREWLAAGSGFLYDRLERDVGLLVERRAEGIAAIDPSGALADTAFPDGGSTVKHAALLLCEWLADHARAGRRLGPAAQGAAVSWRALVQRVRALQAEHAGRWSKEFDPSEAGAEALAREAVRLLAGFGLAAVLPDGGVAARPAAARFAPQETTRGGRP